MSKIIFVRGIFLPSLCIHLWFWLFRESAEKKTDNERTNKKGNDSIKEGKEGNGKANVPPITQNPIGKTTSLIRKWKLFSGHVRIRNLILSPPFLVCCASLVFLWVHFSLQRPRTTRPFLSSFLPHVCRPGKERGISLLSSIRRRKKSIFFRGLKNGPFLQQHDALFPFPAAIFLEPLRNRWATFGFCCLLQHFSLWCCYS